MAIANTTGASIISAITRMNCFVETFTLVKWIRAAREDKRNATIDPIMGGYLAAQSQFAKSVGWFYLRLYPA